jgi:hypothetical protein
LQTPGNWGLAGRLACNRPDYSKRLSGLSFFR